MKIKTIFLVKKSKIAYGLLKCKCHTYPILDGILLIRRDKSPRMFLVFFILKIIPFKSESFQNIISSDVFHYVVNKKPLGKEFKRILTSKGLIALTNLHNKRFSRHFIDPVDYLETPRDYIKFFPNLNFSLFFQKRSHEGILKWIKEKDFSSSQE